MTSSSKTEAGMITDGSSSSSSTSSSSKFSSATFDPKKWVNEQLALAQAPAAAVPDSATPQPGGLVKSASSVQALAQLTATKDALTSLLTNLQVKNQDVAYAIHQSSNELLSALPIAVKELAYVNNEALDLRAHLVEVSKLSQAIEGDNSMSLRVLTDIDGAKGRLDSCFDALREANEWVTRMRVIEEASATGDLQLMATELIHMNRVVEIFANLPEYKDRKGHLKEMEIRLEALAKLQLTTNLLEGNITEVSQIIHIFANINQFELAKSMYYESRCDFVAKSITLPPSSDSSSVVLTAWLPGVFMDLVDVIKREILWTNQVFPAHSSSIMVNLVTRSAAVLETQMSGWIEKHVKMQAARGKSSDADELASVLEIFLIARAFVVRLQRLPSTITATVGSAGTTGGAAVSSAPSISLTQILVQSVCVNAFSPYVKNIKTLETQRLLACLPQQCKSLHAHTVTDGYESLIASLRESFALVQTTAQGTIQRCLQLTGGIEGDASVAALSAYYAAFIDTVQTVLSRHRDNIQLDGTSAGTAPGVSKDATSGASAGGGSGSSSSSGSNSSNSNAVAIDWSQFQGSFEFLRLCNTQRQQLVKFEVEVAMTLSATLQEITRMRHATESDEEDDGSDTEAAAAAESPKKLSSTDTLVFSLLLSSGGNGEKSRNLVARLKKTLLSAQDTGNNAQKGVLLKVVSPSSSSSFSSSSSSSFSVRENLLPAAAKGMEAVLSSVHALIYDAMMLHPTSKLLGMETWDHMWTKVSAGQSAFDQLKLPSFSLPPSEYITHIGEHLLTLVQQLEPLFVKHRDSAVMQDMRGGGGREGADADADAGLDGDADADGADSDDNDALFWLEMVSQGVVKLLLAKMQKIKKLSPLGSKHLSSDMDYLINVLRALGLQMDPLALAVKQVLDITSKEEVAKNEVVFNVSAPSDKAVLQTIVDIRQLGVKL